MIRWDVDLDNLKCTSRVLFVFEESISLIKSDEDLGSEEIGRELRPRQLHVAPIGRESIELAELHGIEMRCENKIRLLGNAHQLHGDIW